MKRRKMKEHKILSQAIILLFMLFSMVTPLIAQAAYKGPDRCWIETKTETYDVGVWVKPQPSPCYCKKPDGSCAAACVVCKWKRNPGSPCGDATSSYKTGTETHSWDETVCDPEATVSGTLLNCNPSGGVCTTPTTLRITANEPVAGKQITYIEGTHNGSAFSCAAGSSCDRSLDPGANAFVYWAHSSYGDTSRKGTTNAQVVVNVPPSVSGATSCGTLGSNGWCVDSGKLNMNATDPQGYTTTISGVLGSAFSCPPGSSCSRNMPQGLGNATFWATSAAGTSSTLSRTWKFDSVPPTLSPQLPPIDGANGWYVSNISASLNAGDATSGLFSKQISVDGGGWQSSVNLSEGVYALDFRAEDNAGLVRTFQETVFIDTTNPSATISVNSTMGNNGWYIQPLKAFVNGMDALSGVDSETISVNGGGFSASPIILADGVHALDFRVTDVAGNVYSTLRNYKVDMTYPTLTTSCSPSSPDGSSGWYVSDVIASFGATDSLSGVASSGVSVNGGAEQGSPVALSDGVHTLDYRTEDVAGNKSASQETFSIDTTDPSVSMSVSGTAGTNGWYTSPIQTSALGSDSLSGVSSRMISVSGGAYQSGTVNLSEGIYSLRYRVFDVAGNMSLATRGYSVDLTDPMVYSSTSIVTPDGDSGWYVSALDIGVSGTDALSGIAEVGISTNGNSYAPGPVHLEDGEYALLFRAEDNAGRATVRSKTVLIDLTEPTSAFTSHSSGALVGGIVQLGGKSQDATSGVYATGEISLDGGTNWSDVPVNAAGEWGAVWNTYKLPNGFYTLLMRARDIAGNQENTARITLRVNNSPPSIELRSRNGWLISESGTLVVESHGIPIDSLTLIIKDPTGACPKRTIALRPQDTKASVTWDRRCGDGTVAPRGEYEVAAIVCDVHGNCADASSTISVPWYHPTPEFLPTFTPTPTITPTTILTTSTPHEEVEIAPTLTALPYVEPTPVSSTSLPPSPKRKADFGKIGSWLLSLAILVTITILSVDPRPTALGNIEKTGDLWMEHINDD